MNSTKHSKNKLHQFANLFQNTEAEGIFPNLLCEVIYLILRQDQNIIKLISHVNTDIKKSSTKH